MSSCAAVVLGSTAAPAVASGWSPLTVIDSFSGILDLSCASSSFCAAVDQGGRVVTFNGSRWSAPTAVDNPYDHFQSISCPSSSFCAAVDADGNAATFNGHAWSGLTRLDPGVPLSGVSCSSASFCMAVDVNGSYSIYTGGSWSRPANYGNNLGGPVSCTSASFCVTVGAGGGNSGIYTYNGSGWSMTPTQAADADSISCASASFCVAVDGDGNAFTYNGSGWSGPQSVENDGLSLESVSCASSSFCLAVDGPARFTYNGSSWSGPVSFSFPHFESVSCASPGFCVAAGTPEGNGFVSLLGGPPGFGPPPGIRITGFRLNQVSPTVRFTFKSIGKATGFQCALVPPPLQRHKHPHFVQCKSPKTYTLYRLGRYAFLVRAISQNGPGPVAVQLFLPFR